MPSTGQQRNPKHSMHGIRYDCTLQIHPSPTILEGTFGAQSGGKTPLVNHCNRSVNMPVPFVVSAIPRQVATTASIMVMIFFFAVASLPSSASVNRIPVASCGCPVARGLAEVLGAQISEPMGSPHGQVRVNETNMEAKHAFYLDHPVRCPVWKSRIVVEGFPARTPVKWSWSKSRGGPRVLL